MKTLEKLVGLLLDLQVTYLSITHKLSGVHQQLMLEKILADT